VVVPLHDEKSIREGDGVNLLLRVSRDFSESRRLTVFALGAAADIASAILKDPSITNRITVVAMGFNDWSNGGDAFNVKNAPATWHISLNSSVPLVIGSTAITSAGLKLTREEAATLMRPQGKTGLYLYQLYEEWLNSRRKLVAQVVGPDTWVI
jgi:inosine-uridine nucleoside N-ribohydrolase